MASNLQSLTSCAAIFVATLAGVCSLQAQTITVRGVRFPDNAFRTPKMLVIQDVNGIPIDTVIGNSFNPSNIVSSVNEDCEEQLEKTVEYYSVIGQLLQASNNIPAPYIKVTRSKSNGHSKSEVVLDENTKNNGGLTAASVRITAYVDHHEPATTAVELEQSDSVVLIPIWLKPWWHRIDKADVDVSLQSVTTDSIEYTKNDGWKTYTHVEPMAFNISTDSGNGTWTWHPNYTMFHSEYKDAGHGDTTSIRILLDTTADVITGCDARWRNESARAIDERSVAPATLTTGTRTQSSALLTVLLRGKPLWDFGISLGYYYERSYNYPGGPGEYLRRVMFKSYESGDDLSYIKLSVRLLD